MGRRFHKLGTVKDIKDSNPIEMAEYAIANKIAEEPVFAWWVPFTLRQRNRAINKVQKKYWRTTHKFGIRLPHSTAEALQMDRENGNTLWGDSIKKEMAKAKVAYQAQQGVNPHDVRSGKVPSFTGFQEMKCHMIFDVKIDFT